METWTRIDNIYELHGMFDHIREEAECQKFDNEDDTEEYVFEKFEDEFPELAKRLMRDDMYIEYYEFDDMDDEDEGGYAVYIHFNQNTMKILKEVYPEYFIQDYLGLFRIIQDYLGLFKLKLSLV